jgi:ATP-dependent DNA helicase RecG
MRETSDGFRIAEEDLRLRGPGEWLGTRQAGDLAFRIVDLLRDEHWLEPARDMAQRLRRDYPDAVPELLHRWVRGGETYAEV